MEQMPRLSAKEALILAALLEQPDCYGLELVKGSGGALKRGTIYVTLGRMEKKGFVTSRKEELAKGAGPPRRLYRATGHGARVLHALETAAALVAGGIA